MSEKTQIDWWNINKYNELHVGVENIHPELVEKNYEIRKTIMFIKGYNESLRRLLREVDISNGEEEFIDE